MTFLDLLVDGEIIREAMLVDNSDGEEILYKGPSLGKRIKNVASFLVEAVPSLRYFVLSLPKKKYIVILINESKYLVLGINSKVNSEHLISQITKSLRELGFDHFDNIAPTGD